MKISEATLKRLTQMYRTLTKMLRYEEEVGHISSAQLGGLIGVPSHTVRKDISCLGEIGSSGRGYDVAKLHQFLAENLGLTESRRTAVVGLGRIGTALIEYGKFSDAGFNVVAGFDANANRVDTLKSNVPLYCAYDIPEIVKRENIELAFLAVPASGAQKSVNRLVEGGIKGIVNFSPLVIQSDKVFIRNVDLSGELTMLSALISVGGLQ